MCTPLNFPDTFARWVAGSSDMAGFAANVNYALTEPAAEHQVVFPK